MLLGTIDPQVLPEGINIRTSSLTHGSYLQMWVGGGRLVVEPHPKQNVPLPQCPQLPVI